MNCQAYIKDGLLYVDFNQASMIFGEMIYPLGDGAMQFSSFPYENLKIAFAYFRSELLANIENGGTEQELLETLKYYVKASYQINPYFNFYLDFYTTILLALRNRKSEILDMIPQLLHRFLLNISGDFDLDSIDYTDAAQATVTIAGLLIRDWQIRQAQLKEDYASITGNAEELASFSPMQKLYILSKQEGRNYLSGEFKMMLKPNVSAMPQEYDLDKMKSALLESKADIVEMVEIKNLDDLLSFELYHTLKADLLIRQCKHCGEFFIVRGRIDTEYCDSVKYEETKPCSVIGATRSYWESKEGDDIYTEFQKAYKRNHSRQRVGKMTQLEFYEWSEEARRKRGEFDKGKLPLEEFRLWLGNKR